MKLLRIVLKTHEIVYINPEHIVYIRDSDIEDYVAIGLSTDDFILCKGSALSIATTLEHINES